MKKLFICDVDGVLIKGQTQKLLLTFLFHQKYISFVFFLKLFFWFFLYKLHIVRDVIRVREEAFAFFKGWGKQSVKDLFDVFVQKEIIPRINPTITLLLEEKIQQGYEVVFASATLMNILIPLREHLNFGFLIGTSLEIVDDIYTGKMIGDVPYGKKKLEAVQLFMKEHHFSFDDSYAITDHISDLPLLKKVSHPMVFEPDLMLKKEANNNRWLIYGV